MAQAAADGAVAGVETQVGGLQGQQHIRQGHQRMGRQQRGPAAFDAQPQCCAIQADHPEHGGRHQRQVEQRAERRVPAARRGFQPGHAPRERQRRRRGRQPQRGEHRDTAVPHAGPGPGAERLGPEIREGPDPGHAAQGKGREHRPVDGDQQCPTPPAAAARRCRQRPARAGVEPRAKRSTRRHQAPQPHRHRHRQREHTARRRALGVGSRVGILQPLPGQHGQGRGAGRANDQRHVHDGEAIGQHGHQRPDQARRQLGPDHEVEGPARRVAQRLCQVVLGPPAPAHIVALQLGRRGPQQEGGFLERQRRDQAQAPGVLCGGQGRRGTETGQPGRHRAQHPAAGCEQEDQADGKGRMRCGKHGRQAAQHPGEPPLHEALRKQRPRRPPGQDGRRQRGPHAQGQGAGPLRVLPERAPGVGVEQRAQRQHRGAEQGQGREQQQRRGQGPAHHGGWINRPHRNDGSIPSRRAPPRRRAAPPAQARSGSRPRAGAWTGTAHARERAASPGPARSGRPNA